MQPKRHDIISGTGRSGTTFLVQLLTQLGLDTGFDNPWPIGFLNSNCNAGMECSIRAPFSPYVIKSPSLCTELDDLLAEGNAVIDHVFVPVRDLFSAAESRRDVERRARSYSRAPVSGGLWDVSRASDQEAVLALKQYELMATIAKWNIPHTLLAFPRIVNDAVYLYEKLAPVLGDCSVARFQEAFTTVARPDLVHNFMPPLPRRLTAVG